MSVCNFEIKEANGRKCSKTFSQNIEVLDREQAMQYAILPEKYYGFAWNKMYKKTQFCKICCMMKRYVKVKIHHLRVNIYQNVKRLYIKYIALYYYRQDTVSITRSKFNLGKN